MNDFPEPYYFKVGSGVSILPTYNFLCNNCNKNYESLVLFDPKGRYASVSCPHCNSKKKKKLLNDANVKFAQPKDTSKFDNFNYRAGYNLEQAQNLRRDAEKASNAGENPYRRIDDISSGNHFGEVE